MNFIKTNNRGFTMVELLIVLAIIAILTSIAIPIYSGQLENSRVKIDESNLRAATGLAVQDYLVRYAGKEDTIRHTVRDWGGIIYHVLGLKNTGDNQISSKNMLVFPAGADVDINGAVIGILGESYSRRQYNNISNGRTVAFNVPVTTMHNPNYGAPELDGRYAHTKEHREYINSRIGNYNGKQVVLFPVQQNNGNAWFMINIGANGVIINSKIALTGKSNKFIP